MKTKTNTLTGAALDWAVAKCESALPASYNDWTQTWPFYSTVWVHAGPIIEREQILFLGEWCNYTAWIPNVAEGIAKGETHLIAAMRCYVASKLGEEVDIPDELIK